MPAEGSQICINIPDAVDTELKAENIPLDILFEDEHLLIVNKPAGMVVHPAPGNYTGTLVNAVLFHCDDLQGIGGEKRPGIVHRLDKEQLASWLSRSRQKRMRGYRTCLQSMTLIEYTKRLFQQKTFHYGKN